MNYKTIYRDGIITHQQPHSLTLYLRVLPIYIPHRKSLLKTPSTTRRRHHSARKSNVSHEIGTHRDRSSSPSLAYTHRGSANPSAQSAASSLSSQLRAPKCAYNTHTHIYTETRVYRYARRCERTDADERTWIASALHRREDTPIALHICRAEPQFLSANERVSTAVGRVCVCGHARVARKRRREDVGT